MPTLIDDQQYRDDLVEALYYFEGHGQTFEQFTTYLDEEYAYLLMKGEVTVGFTNIIETVPPVPAACD